MHLPIFDYNPREDDNLGTMVCFHGRYDLGDEHNYDTGDYSGWKEMEQAIIKREDPAVILPVYGYDHSIFDIATQVQPYWWHYSWDGGQLGFIFASKEKVRQELGVKRITPKVKAEVQARLEAEVEDYAAYVRGDTEEVEPWDNEFGEEF